MKDVKKLFEKGKRRETFGACNNFLFAGIIVITCVDILNNLECFAKPVFGSEGGGKGTMCHYITALFVIYWQLCSEGGG